jgi:hypothetical protein
VGFGFHPSREAEKAFHGRPRPLGLASSSSRMPPVGLGQDERDEAARLMPALASSRRTVGRNIQASTRCVTS